MIQQKRFLWVVILGFFMSIASTAFLTASAAETEKPKMNIAEFEPIVSEMLTFPHDEPINGKDITLRELDAILDPYRSKRNRNGNTLYSKIMTGDFVRKNDKWELGQEVNIDWFWATSSRRNMYNEVLTVTYQSDTSHVGVIDVRVVKEDDKFMYIYTWFKGNKTGHHMKIPKDLQKPICTPEKFGQEDRDIAKKEEPAVLYEDQTVAGQLCKVYRFGKFHHWFSTVKGHDIMTAEYNTKGKSVTQKINFIYDMFVLDKDNSFFEPPNDIEFWRL